MKTLDEVIQEFGNMMPETCDECPFICLAKSEDDCPMFVALHYLKEYQAGQKAVDATIARYDEAVRNCEKAENKYYMLCELNRQPNNPLTWDELQQMAGKPVWVEKCQDDEPKGWLLILRTNADVVNCTTKHGNSFYLYRSLYGEKWQAYRKERDAEIQRTES